MNARTTLGISRADESARNRFDELNHEAAVSLRCAVGAGTWLADYHTTSALAYATDAVGARYEARALRAEQAEIDAVLARWSA